MVLQLRMRDDMADQSTKLFAAQVGGWRPSARKWAMGYGRRNNSHGGSEMTLKVGIHFRANFALSHSAVGW